MGRRCVRAELSLASLAIVALAATTLLLWPVPLRALAGAKDPEQLFAKGVALHQAGDTIGAIQYYQDVLELQPNRVEARSNLGAAFVKLGRYDDAIEQYRKALAVKPDMTPVRLNLGLALYKAGRIAEAATEFQAVLKAEPKNRSATLLLADCFNQMGETKKVVDLLGPLEGTFTGDRLFDYLFGTALISQHDVARGQRVIDRLFSGSESAEAHLLLGAQYLSAAENRPEFLLKAQPELEKAIALNPDLPMAHGLYAKILQQNRDHEAAAREFAEELKRNPNDFDSNLRLGLLRREENRLDEAATYLERARRLRPRETSVAWALGRVHLAANRLQEAREELEQVVRASPSYQPGHVVLATTYYRLGLKTQGDEQRAIVQTLKAQASDEQEQAEKQIGPTSFRTEGAPSP